MPTLSNTSVSMTDVHVAICGVWHFSMVIQLPTLTKPGWLNTLAIGLVRVSAKRVSPHFQCGVHDTCQANSFTSERRKLKHPRGALVSKAASTLQQTFEPRSVSVDRRETMQRACARHRTPAEQRASAQLQMVFRTSPRHNLSSTKIRRVPAGEKESAREREPVFVARQ